MEEKKVYRLYGHVWNPAKCDYFIRLLKAFEEKESAIRSIKRRQVTSDIIQYDLEEGVMTRWGEFDSQRRIMQKSDFGIDDYVVEYYSYD